MTDPRMIQVTPAAVPHAPARVIGPAPATRPEPLLRWVLGDILRRIRQQQGRTLKDVSLAAQVSMPYLSEVERGLKEASSEVLAAICHALDLTVADLLALAHGELSDVPLSRALLSDTELAPSTTAPSGSFSTSGMGPVSLSVAA